MGWERRRRGPTGGYYYESVRVDGRVRKRYLGRGDAGHQAADALQRRRQARTEASTLLQAEHNGTHEADLLAHMLREWAATLLSVELIAAGYHKHRGEWRKKRVQKA